MLVVQVGPDRHLGGTSEYLEAGRVDGFVLLSATCTQGHIRTLLDLRAPFILWGIPPGNHGYCSVGGDSSAGGRIATEHLVASGRRRIAFLGGPAAEAAEVRERYGGYEAALRDAGPRGRLGARRVRGLVAGSGARRCGS